MNFKELQEANEQIKTTNIKGKEYAEVNQRIKAFRMLYPQGFIRTEIKSLQGGVCIIRAEVGEYVRDNEKLPQKVVYGTGTAYEKEGSSNINRTSYIENCETSAVGRALGMMGIGIDTSVASYEEVANAIENQTISKKDAQIARNTLTQAQIDWIRNNKGKEIEELTNAEYGELMHEINKRANK